MSFTAALTLERVFCQSVPPSLLSLTLTSSPPAPYIFGYKVELSYGDVKHILSGIAYGDIILDYAV